MNPLLAIARFRMGRPPRGRVSVLRRGAYTFEQGVEFPVRFREAFGDPTECAVADLGAGPGETRIADQILAIPFRRLVSVEAFAPYAERLRETRSAAAEREVVESRIEAALDRPELADLDVALLIDVLEHFPRAAALRLLVRLRRKARRGAMIFVPIGHVEQDALDENELQRHRSFWTAAQLTGLGFDVTVCEGVHGHLDPPADAAWAVARWDGSAGKSNPA